MNREGNIVEAVPLQRRQQKDTGCKFFGKKKATCKKIWKQLLATIAISWVSFIIGYSSAYTSPAQESLQSYFNISENEMSWISSFMPLGALVGALLGGTLIEYLGRKWTIFLTNILFLGSWLINYLAQNYIYLYIGRVTTGLSVGIATLTSPVYLVEAIQPEVRGTLGLLPTAAGNIGILVCYAFGNLYEWRELALIGIIISLPFLVMIWFIPETPKFLIAKGDVNGAQKSLQWLRGTGTVINKELQELLENFQDSKSENESVLALFNVTNFKLLAIVLGLMFFQQFSGINAVVSYTSLIFNMAVSALPSGVSTTVVGAVNFISTFIAAILIDKVGRKILLYISGISIIVSLGILGTYFYLKTELQLDLSSLDWLPLLSFVIYILGFSLGYGPVPWLMMGEILPAKIRGPAASVSTAFNWTCSFIVTKTFLLMPTHYGFWMYSAILVIGLIFCILVVPETRGLSLTDIEKELADLNVRRVSSVANLQPTPSTC